MGQLVRYRFGVFFGDQESAIRILYELRDTGMVGTYDRQLRCHGFLQHNRKTFLVAITARYAGGKEYVSLFIKPQHFGPILETKQLDVSAHSEFADQLFQIGSLGAIAHDVILNIGKSMKNL